MRFSIFKRKDDGLPVVRNGQSGIFMVFLIWSLVFLFMNFLVGMPLIIFVFIAISIIYLRAYYKKAITGFHRQLSLLLMLILGYAISYGIVYFAKLPAYYIPVASIPILITLLFSHAEIALFSAIIMSVIVGLVSGGDFYLSVVFLVGGIVGITSSWQARRRSQIVRAGLLVGLTQFFALAFFFKFRFIDYDILRECFILGVNGLLSAALAMLLLPILEYLSKTVTNISLLELSDMNFPLIKRMILEAPGTYHHSLIVGNLSEAAAQAIGANALLARVGSYYHDIGKLEKPNYFSENQKESVNAHESLSASMSKLVIMNHVKEGLDLAKKYHLKPSIVDFIGQHHGTSLVYYFYRRAIEEGKVNEAKDQEPFRYPGPKPQTKETAIVLLADSVEAATRSLDEPTPTRIKEVVAKMINNKFIDGQLDECELTLKDLETISEVFVHILSGIYHSRVEYPDDDENNNKKPTKKISNKRKENNNGFKSSP